MIALAVDTEAMAEITTQEPATTDARTVLTVLEQGAVKIGQLTAPGSAGVYLVALAAPARLPHVGPGGALYVGCSSDLAAREFETHFCSGKTAA